MLQRATTALQQVSGLGGIRRRPGARNKMSEQPPRGPDEPADSGLPAQQPGWYFDPNGLPVMLNVPDPQPQVPRTRRRRRNRTTRNALIGIGGLAAIIVVIIVATANNSPSTGNTATAASLSAAPSAVATATASGCAGQAISWRNNGALTQINAVVTDMGRVQTAASALSTDLSAGTTASRDETSLKTAATTLQSDVQTAQADPPPPCVPHLGADESAALNNASKAALNSENAISEVGSANLNVAVTDIEAVNADIATSEEMFQDANSDMQQSTTGN